MFLIWFDCQAALGTADLLTEALKIEGGLTDEQARGRIWLTDRKGLLAEGRPGGAIDAHQSKYAKKVEPTNELSKIIDLCRPSCLIGMYPIFYPVITCDS